MNDYTTVDEARAAARGRADTGDDYQVWARADGRYVVGKLRLTEPLRAQMRRSGLTIIGEGVDVWTPEEIMARVAAREAVAPCGGCDHPRERHPEDRACTVVNRVWVDEYVDTPCRCARYLSLQEARKMGDEALRQAAEDERRQRAAGLCPRCNTYCYGDCSI